MQIPKSNLKGVPCAVEEHMDSNDLSVTHGLVLVYEYGKGFSVEIGRIVVGQHPVGFSATKIPADKDNHTHLPNNCPLCKRELNWMNILL